MQDSGVSSNGIGDRLGALRQTLVGAFGVMIVATTLAGVLNYVFSIIMTRMLGEAGAFASFNSLNSIFLIVSMGAVSFQTVITKYVAEYEITEEPHKTKALVEAFSRWLVILAVAVLAVSIAVAWPLGRLLKLDSPVFVIIMGTSLAVTLYLTLPYGLLQGQQRFIGLGTASIASAVLRIVAGVVLVELGLGVYGALGAATVAGVIVATAIIYYYRDFLRGKAEKIEDFHPAKALWTLIPVAVGVFLVIFMTQIDVVLVKALKTGAQADLYSYAALAGKAVLFFPAGITLVMFPRVSQLRATGRSTRRVLWLSMAACLLLEGAVVGFYWLFPDFTASFFAGKHGKQIAQAQYKGIFGLQFVVLFGIVMAVFALVNVLVYYHLALDRRAFIGLLLAGAVAEIAGIVAYHKTLPDILLVMLIVGVALLAANLALALKEAPAGPQTSDYSNPSDVPIN
ncbi:MAG TPA: oligosaccharide flippase family protein [Candidatus Anoxymicrobiaceae bacterium]